MDVLHTRERDDEGEPVAVLVAVTPGPAMVEAGMMFVRAKAKAGVYEFVDPNDDRMSVMLRMPTEAIDLPRDAWSANITLEVT